MKKNNLLFDRDSTVSFRISSSLESKIREYCSYKLGVPFSTLLRKLVYKYAVDKGLVKND